MPVTQLNHYTLCCSPARLPDLVDFYISAVGLTPGRRPDFGFEGVWLYSGALAIVHLAANAEHQEKGTGPLDHISFTARDLEGTRQLLASRNIPFDQTSIEGWSLHQLFLRDPTGLKVELTFSTSD